MLVGRMALARGPCAEFPPMQGPHADALRLTVTLVGRRALARGPCAEFPSVQRPHADALRLMGIAALSVLHIARVQNDFFQSRLGIDALPIATSCPNRAIAKPGIDRPQLLRAFRLQLIPNAVSRISGCRHHHVNMIRSRIDHPQFPASISRNFSDGIFDADTVRRR